MPAHAREALRVPREHILEFQDERQNQQTRAGKGQRAAGVFFPAHILLRVHAKQFVKSVFTWAKHGREEALFARHGVIDVFAQWDREHAQKCEVKNVLQESVHITALLSKVRGSDK